MKKKKSYGKSELALLYFPKATTPMGALSNLNSWIKGNEELYTELKNCGMPPKLKYFTPREVELIIHYLGDPE